MLIRQAAAPRTREAARSGRLRVVLVMGTDNAGSERVGTWVTLWTEHMGDTFGTPLGVDQPAAVVAREGVWGRDIHRCITRWGSLIGAVGPAVPRAGSGRRGLAQAAVGRIEQSQLDGSVAHAPAIGSFVDAHWFADQQVAHVDRAARPADLAIVAHAPHLVRLGITGLLQPPRVAADRGCIPAHRRLLIERFVGDRKSTRLNS